MRVLAVLILTLLTSVRPAWAQETGVVWAVPEDFRTAASDLLEMHEVGMRHVRTGAVSDPSILGMADSLGITLYRDNPAWGLSTRALEDSLAGLRDETARLAGARAPGWIGLGSWLSTGDAQTCEILGALAEIVRKGGHQAYYVTPLVEADGCGHTVDMVLLDVLDEMEPARILALYRRAHPDVKVGLASTGIAVIPGRPAGHNIPGSAAYQARFMESVLTGLHGETMFLHRWRDHPESDPWGRRYGLYDRLDNPRPALQVVRGLSLGIQDAFALPRADAPSPFPWLPVMGWCLLGFLGVLYAGSPRFRSMVPRYFMAHGFYRNAVREAREVLPLTSTALITVAGLSIGLVGTVFLTGVHDSVVGRYVYGHMPTHWQPGITAILETPIVLAILLGCMALLSLSFWMSLWVVVSGKRAPLLASQALMLAVWPRWQVLPLVPVAMVLYGTPYVLPKVGLGVLWIVSSHWASIRTAVDISRVSRIRPGTAILLSALNPEFLLAVVVLLWMLLHSGETAMALTLLGRDFGYG